MNKARAYRELQRRQGKIGKLWTEVTSGVSQSFDPSMTRSALTNRNSDMETASIQVSLSIIPWVARFGVSMVTPVLYDVVANMG